MNAGTEHWKTYIETELMKPNVVFPDLYGILLEMKEKGVERKMAYKVLTEIRNSDNIKFGESKKDLVLELLDVVEDWCSPRLRIW